jgi:ParB-like chromosome segregation protein Spo0J
MLDDLPPVVVFDTPEGPLLADGHHRLAAAGRLGRKTVEAEVRAGSRQDALRYAAEVGGA